MNKVRGIWVAMCGAALGVGEAMAAAPAAAVPGHDEAGPDYAVALGLGLLVLMLAMFRRQRGRS